jgi:hypothetical protein
MSLSFQERFRNRSNFMGKLGWFDFKRSASVSKPKSGQLFDAALIQAEKIPSNEPEAIKTNRKKSMSSLRIHPPQFNTRKNPQSANPFNNLIEMCNEYSKYPRKNSQEFKPYTLKDYQSIRNHKYYELGGLGPSNIGTKDWKQRKSVSDKRSFYAERIKLITFKPEGACRSNEGIRRYKSYKLSNFTPVPASNLKSAPGGSPPLNSILEDLERQYTVNKVLLKPISSIMGRHN